MSPVCHGSSVSCARMMKMQRKAASALRALNYSDRVISGLSVPPQKIY